MGSRGSKVTAATCDDPTPVMTESRKCRDICCIPIFLSWWALMIFVAVFGIKYGDPARLLYGVDYKGNNCGGSDGICVGSSSCGKYLTYPQMDQDLYRAQQENVLNDPAALIDFPFYGVCRNSCPEGVSDVNGDGEIDNWVCSYETMDYLNSNYGLNSASKEIPSPNARIALEECLEEKKNSPFMSSQFLSTSKTLSNGQVANCKTLMRGCWKMYAEERSLFFRCIPQDEDNSTCTRSPYLEYQNKSVSHKYVDGRRERRKATDPSCGICLDPELDEEGYPMDPGSKLCKAKKVYSTSVKTKVTINPAFSAVNTWTANLQKWMGDIQNTAWQVSVCGTVIPFLLGVVFLIFLRFFAKTFIYVALWGLLICFLFLTLQFLIYGDVITASMLANTLEGFSNFTGIKIDSASAANDITSVDVFAASDNEKTKTYAIVGWIFAAITIIYLILLVGLRQRVRIAVAVIREATKCIAVMPSILVFPGLSVVATFGLAAYWAWISLYLASMGKVEEIDISNLADMSRRRALSNQNNSVGDTASLFAEASIAHLETISYTKYFWLIHLFGFLWTNQLIQAIACTTIAGAVGSWYWASPNEEEKSSSMSKHPIRKSLGRVFRYHLGSLMFGSFIIAIVQLIRFVLMYIDKQTQGLQKKNKMVKILMKAIHCCLWCLEKVLKFITKNAYIMIALFGKSFCTSTKDAFVLIVLNLARIGTATAISNLIILIGRVLIVTLSAYFCVLILSVTETGEDKPSSIVPPVAVSALLAWFVSGCFMNVYGLTIDTIMISFCVDEQKNDGSPSKPYYMTKSLRKITKKYNKKKLVESEQGSDIDYDAPPALVKQKTGVEIL